MVRARPSDPNKGGAILDCGWHHVQVTECEEAKNTDKEGNVQVFAKFKCLASSDPSQVGKERHDYMSVTGDRAWLFWLFTDAVGLTTHDQRKAAHEAGEEIEVDETAAIGRSLCLKIEMGKPYKKDNIDQPPRPEIKGRYAVWDAAAKDCPKDPVTLQMMRAAGMPTTPEEAAAIAAKSQPAATGQATAAAPAGNKWDDPDSPF